MELHIVWTEQEIHNLLWRFKQFEPAVLQPVEPQPVIEQRFFSESVTTPVKVEDIVPPVHPRRWHRWKVTSLFIGDNLFKKFVSVTAAAQFLWVKDSAVHFAFKNGSKVKRLYMVKIDSNK
jgi:hypothetical protein